MSPSAGALDEFVLRAHAKVLDGLSERVNARAEVVFRIPADRARLILLAARDHAHWEHRDGVTRDRIYLAGCEDRLLDALRSSVSDEKWTEGVSRLRVAQRALESSSIVETLQRNSNDPVKAAKLMQDGLSLGVFDDLSHGLKQQVANKVDEQVAKGEWILKGGQ